MKRFIWSFFIVGALLVGYNHAKAAALGDPVQQSTEINNTENTNELILIKGGKNGGEGHKAVRQHRKDGGDHKTFRKHRDRDRGDHKSFRSQKRHGGEKKLSHRRHGKRDAYAHKRHRGDRHYADRKHHRQHAKRGHHGDRKYAHKRHHKEHRNARWEKGNKEKHENWKNGYYRNHKKGYYRNGKGSHGDHGDNSDFIDSEVFESDEGTVEPESMVQETGRGMMERVQDRVVDEVFRRILP